MQVLIYIIKKKEKRKYKIKSGGGGDDRHKPNLVNPRKKWKQH